MAFFLNINKFMALGSFLARGSKSRRAYVVTQSLAWRLHLKVY